MALTMEQVLNLLEKTDTVLNEAVMTVREKVTGKDGKERNITRTEITTDKVSAAKQLIDHILGEIDGSGLSVEEIGTLKSSLLKVSTTAREKFANPIIQKTKFKDSNTELSDMIGSMQPLIEKLTDIDKAVKEYSQKGYDVKDHQKYEQQKINAIEAENAKLEATVEDIETLDEFGNIFEMYELEENRREILTVMQEKYQELKEIIDQINSGLFTDKEKEQAAKNMDSIVEEIKDLQNQYNDIEELIRQTGARVPQKVDEFEEDPIDLVVNSNTKWIGTLIEDTRKEQASMKVVFKAKMKSFANIDEKDEPEAVKRFRKALNITYAEFKAIDDIEVIHGAGKQILEKVEENKKKIDAIKGTLTKLEAIERATSKGTKSDVKSKVDDATLLRQGQNEIERIFQDSFKENSLLVGYNGKQKMSKEMVAQLKDALKKTVYKDSKIPGIRAWFSTLPLNRKRALKKVQNAYRKDAETKFLSNVKAAAKKKAENNKAKAKTIAEKYRVEGLKQITQSKVNAKTARENMYEKLDREI